MSSHHFKVNVKKTYHTLWCHPWIRHLLFTTWTYRVSQFHYPSFGGWWKCEILPLTNNFFAHLGGVDWWNHITLRKHLCEGLKDEESSNCEKYTCIKNQNFFCLLFSRRDGSIFVSISLEIHSSQVWSESICFSNMFTPQTKPVTRTSKQPTHTQSTQRTISRHHHDCKNLSHNHRKLQKL